MNKLIKLFITLTLASSLAMVSAQVTGGSGCVVINGQQICAGVNPNQNPNGQPQAGYTQCPNGTQVPNGYPCANTGNNGPYTGGSAYQQGQNVRSGMGTQADLSFFGNLIAGVGGLVRMLPPILLGIAVVVFFFFLIKYLIAGKNDPKEKGKHMQGMLYALLAIFIMVTLWGIIAFFGDAIGINPNVQVNAPALPVR